MPRYSDEDHLLVMETVLALPPVKLPQYTEAKGRAEVRRQVATKLGWNLVRVEEIMEGMEAWMSQSLQQSAARN